MTDTTVPSALNVQQWSRKLHYEYVRDNKLKKLMGKSMNAPIQIVEELQKQPGDQITVPMIARIQGAGQTGDNTLEGNEVALSSYGHKITVDQIRQAVRRGRAEQKKTFFDLLKAARPMLKKWAMSKMRDDILLAMESPNIDGSTTYAASSNADRDAWLAANSDRVLFGAAKSNNATNDHSAALLNVDSTTDVLTPGTASLLKRMIKSTTGRHVEPTSVSDQGEFFIMLCNSFCFRDLKNNSVMIAANREARNRGKDNPIFVDGDLQYDGIIFKEIEEIPVISGAGASSIDVAANFMLGANAVGVAVGEMLHPIKNVRDYGNKVGTGVAEIRGIDKLMYNDVQNMGTLYCAAVADS